MRSFIKTKSFRKAKDSKKNFLFSVKNEDKYKMIFRSMTDGIVITDRKGLITLMNPAAEKLSGISSDAALGKPVSDILILKNSETKERIVYSPENFDEYKKNIRLLRNKILVLKDGTERTISENVSLVKDNNGEYSMAVIVIRDMTGYQKIEDELKQSNMINSLAQFAGGIAHDFNNMIGAIMGSAELLLIHLKNDEMLSGYGETIINASEKAAEMTHKLIALSRKSKIRNEPVDIHKLIDKVLTLLHGRMGNRIRLASLKNAEKFFIEGDNTLIENALIHLGINSRDAISGGGVIEISTDNIYLDSDFCEMSPAHIMPGDYIEIKISDNGSGIPENLARKIFEPFFTTKKCGKASGLGLSIVYATVKEHNGMIKFNSEPDKGTTFTIYLPVIEKKFDHEIKDRNFSYTGSGQVLIIDDEELIRESSANLLKNMSYEVLTASNGDEGIDLLIKNIEKIKLVILDMIMPKMDGRETFMKLREINPSLTVILSSGYARDMNVQELIRMGAAGFVQKPYKSSDLAYILMTIDKKNKMPEQQNLIV